MQAKALNDFRRNPPQAFPLRPGSTSRTYLLPQVAFAVIDADTHVASL
jgi:hypothetical protein